MLAHQRNIFLVGGIFFLGLFAGIALVYFLQAKPQPEPDTSKLNELLHNTAQKEIGLPPLADAELELTIERGQLDREDHDLWKNHHLRER